MLYCYFFFENKFVLSRFSKSTEIFLIFYVGFIFAFVMKYIDPLAQLARPIAFVALMCATIFRRRDAIFINTIFSLTVLTVDRFTDITGIANEHIYYASLLCSFCAGMVAVFVFDSIKTRIQSVLLAFILLIPVEVINCIIIIPVGIGQYTV